MAILKTIQEDYPHLSAHVNKYAKTNKPEQRNNTFCFPTPENPCKPENDTAREIRILRELIELKEKEQFNHQVGTESRTTLLERFYWTDTMLTETQKQAIKDFLVEHNDIFARHRLDIGMNTDSNLKLTRKDDKAVYGQSLPLPI